MRRLLVYICLILAASIIKSQDFDFLKPASSIYSEYDFQTDYKIKIRNKLLSDLSDSPIARTIVCPSFEPEFVISIEAKLGKNGRDYDESKKYLILKTCYPSIWSCYMSANDSSIVSTKEILIDSVLSQVIEKLFQTVLSKARFPLESTDGIDGTSYYFMSTIEFEGVQCGCTWSPDSGTKMFELCGITDLLRNYCQTNDAEIRNDIISRSNKLLVKFEDNHKIKQIVYERFMWISLTTILVIVIILLIVRIRKSKEV